MTQEEFADGWRILLAGLGKNPDTSASKTMANINFKEHFQNKNGSQFIQACKNLAERGVEHFEPVQNILSEMKDITVEYVEELYVESCNKCERGLIFRKDNDGYSYVSRCTCKAGQQRKYNGLWTVDKGYLAELDVKKPVSDREYQILMNQMWDKLEMGKMKKELPPPGIYFNSEHYKGADNGSLEVNPHWDGDRSKFVSSDEIRKLRQALGEVEDESKEAERKNNIRNKSLDEIPF